MSSHTLSQPASRLFFASTVALAGLLAVLVVGQAQADDTPAAAPDSVNLQELQQKVLILERKLEVKDEEAATKAADAPKFTAGPDGFVFKSADGAAFCRSITAISSTGRIPAASVHTSAVTPTISREPSCFARCVPPST